MPRDHPDGAAPKTIKDDSEDFSKFQEALDAVANESQVMLIADTKYIYKNTRDLILSKLPEGSYIQHHRITQVRTVLS